MPEVNEEVLGSIRTHGEPTDIKVVNTNDMIDNLLPGDLRQVATDQSYQSKRQQRVLYSIESGGARYGDHLCLRAARGATSRLRASIITCCKLAKR